MNEKKMILIEKINNVNDPEVIDFLYLFVTDLFRVHSVGQTIVQSEECVPSDLESTLEAG